MNDARNELCRCGSGKKYKKCCGRLTAPSAASTARAATHPIPLSPDLGVERFGDANSSDPFEAAMVRLARRGNVSQAESHIRARLARDPGNARALNMLGWIAAAVGQWSHAARSFESAIAASPSWQSPRGNLERIAHHLSAPPTPAVAGERFLLIKAWGYGFWSDVSHVLGQLLVARLSLRTPVVHWGANSLFSPGPESNAWIEFFESVSNTGIESLAQSGFDYWPPKWTRESLGVAELQKFSGPYSRVAGLWLLSRGERVIISDFFTGILDLIPWIPEDHPLRGRSVHDLARMLVREHLRPKTAIVDEVDRFCAAHLPPGGWLAVHARGSDKALEIPQLDKVNRETFARIDARLASNPNWPIFLMTDDARVLANHRARYGERIVTTACSRTGTDQGIHYQKSTDPSQLGREVLVDTLIAARATAFVGNGFSNASVIVRYLKNWPEGDCVLIGPNLFERANPVLHAW